MSSTIQIKRGTGSAVPSSLEDGELAINLDDGIADIDVADDLRLDPGGGNVYVDGNITASGNIIGTVDGGTF